MGAKLGDTSIAYYIKLINLWVVKSSLRSGRFFIHV